MSERKHGHYKKSVVGLEFIDVYRVVELFGITDPCIQHALKKVIVAGGRGVKSTDKDIQEAIDSLQRWQEMRAEDARAASTKPAEGSRQPIRHGLKCLMCGVLHGSGEICPVMAPISNAQAEWPTPEQEKRQEVIDQNGNTGEHYDNFTPQPAV